MPGRGKRLSLDQINKAVEFYKHGLAVSQIGERFGVSPSAISYNLKKKRVELVPNRRRCDCGFVGSGDRRSSRKAARFPLR